MSLRIAGYAALFDIPDAGGDVIARGAFARTLAEQRAAPLPLFWQHRPDQPIGAVELAAEDARGLRVIARIDNGQGRAAAALGRGEATGLSFGYRARGYQRLPEGRCCRTSS
jgi:HK97 family phage prohead protease